MRELPQCNRDMFLFEDAFYEVEEDGYKSIIKREASKPKTLQISVEEAIKNRSNSFLYNNKVFYLKKDKSDIIIELNFEKQNEVYGYLPNKKVELQTNMQEVK